MTRTNWPLAPMERKTLRALESAPNGITREQLIGTLYADRPGGPPKTADAAVAVFVSHVRAALVSKTVRTEYGSGRYRLVDIGPCVTCPLG